MHIDDLGTKVTKRSTMKSDGGDVYLFVCLFACLCWNRGKLRARLEERLIVVMLCLFLSLLFERLGENSKNGNDG